MGPLLGQLVVFVFFSIAQQSVSAVPGDDKFEPMVAFICGKPAMHRGVSGWIGDEKMLDCLDEKTDILNYCRNMYPNHNITNVVEAAYLVTIPGWPSLQGKALHSHRLRPFRCIVGPFQSDALLVPQHCVFDHQHDEKVCKGFSHWEVTAQDACSKKGMHCESFGMLLNCGLGVFSGVEYVCCPDATSTRVHPLPSAKDSDESDSDEDKDDDPTAADDDDDDIWESDEDEEEDDDDDDDDDEKTVDEDKVNLYELYLKGEPMPSRLHNEHQKFVAARQYMHKLQEAKNTQLMKEWTAARDHVNEVRKTDDKMADKLSKEITERFQRLYNAYEQEDIAEKQQIVALHQQRVQADLNQRKRVAMDKYMRSLERGDMSHIAKNLRQYIRSEEKDITHTVDHYSHVRQTNSAEATRIHPHVIKHLQLCQQRMEQALEMLERYPDIERKVRPEIEEFMKKFEDTASRIRNIVLPDPATASVQTDSTSDSEENTPSSAAVQPQMIDQIKEDVSSDEENDDEEEHENEHSYLHQDNFMAHQQESNVQVQQDLRVASAATSSSQFGTTFGIAIGSVAVFIMLVVAVVMLRRRSSPRTSVTHGYVEVDPAASPEERHVANMQMNGYENPTYRYFEVHSQQ